MEKMEDPKIIRILTIAERVLVAIVIVLIFILISGSIKISWNIESFYEFLVVAPFIASLVFLIIVIPLLALLVAIFVEIRKIRKILQS
ncbi:MAG: hypothetical protein Q6363_008130 [Candidatus Njordarchaeota archaeon]